MSHSKHTNTDETTSRKNADETTSRKGTRKEWNAPRVMELSMKHDVKSGSPGAEPVGTPGGLS